MPAQPKIKCVNRVNLLLLEIYLESPDTTIFNLNFLMLQGTVSKSTAHYARVMCINLQTYFFLYKGKMPTYCRAGCKQLLARKFIMKVVL